MCEHAGITPAAALREARRRKILENSTNRLKIIEGINSSLGNAEPHQETKPEPDTRDTNKTSDLSDVNSKLADIIKSNHELKKISDFLLQDHSKPDESEELIEEGESEVENNVRSIEETRNFYIELLVQKRLHYVILAVAVNILLFFNVGFLFYENIFCPFYTVKAIELLSRGKEKEDFQPVLSLVVASLPPNVQKSIKIFITVFVALLSDLCIYLFTFILGTKIINTQE